MKKQQKTTTVKQVKRMIAKKSLIKGRNKPKKSQEFVPTCNDIIMKTFTYSKLKDSNNKLIEPKRGPP